MKIFKVQKIDKNDKNQKKQKQKINKKKNTIENNNETIIKIEENIKKILNNKRNREKKQKENNINTNNINTKNINTKNINTVDHNSFEKSNISTNPESINNFYELTNDSESFFFFDNTFCVFKSIDDILYLVYSNRNSIISYNLIDRTKINEIKNVNDKNKYITNFRHYLDINNKRDLLISISAWSNSIKVWNVNTWECLNNIKNINKRGYLYSATFLYDNNNIYIITSNHRKKNYNYYLYNHNYHNYNYNYNYDYDFDYDNDYHNNYYYNYNSDLNYSEGIKIFDLNGNKINSISDSYDNTFSIDTYYDNNLNKLYIITGNIDCVKSYDYCNNTLYHKYENNVWKGNEYHYCTVISDKDKIIRLIESSSFGIIRIWNFHSGQIIKKIKVSESKGNKIKLFGICLWDNNNIFVGGEDGMIKLIDYKKGKIIKELDGHENWVLSIKKINHPYFGECLISQGYSTDQIKLISKLK